MNWFETEDGILINLDYIKYVYNAISDGRVAVFDKEIIISLSRNDYKNIRNKLLNKGEN